MVRAYYNCTNLTGLPVFGNNTKNMAHAYGNCKKLSAGNVYIYYNQVVNMTGCFAEKNNSRRFNIHVPANSTTLNKCLYNNSLSIVNANITWTTSGSNYYNKAYNIYIYPDLT